ncbi:MAG: DUF4364 family protein [Clostridia bacterium]|nr:DUF4364 family protein [Clostridia bacterium]
MIDRKVSPMEHKLLILYTIKQLGSVTNLQLLQFMVDNQFMDYMTLQLALGEMLETGQLEMLPHALGALYQLTPQGKEALSMFVKRVPYSRRKAAQEAARAWKRRFELEQQLLSDFEKRPDGQFDLSLSLLENGSPQMLIHLVLPAWNMADCFARAWPKQAQAIYAHILQALGDGYQAAQRQLSQQTGCTLIPQENGEALMKLFQGEDPILTLAFPLPSDEDVACHMAQHFQGLEKSLCNFITAQLAKA